MKVVTFILNLVFIFIFTPIYSFASIVKEFPVSTEINKSNFYNGVITNVYFDDEILELKFNSKQGQFENISTNLNIETDISSKDAMVPYHVSISDKRGTCQLIDEKVEDINSDNVELNIDGAKIDINEFVKFKFLTNSDSEYQYARHAVSFKYEKLDLKNFTNAVKSCSGSVAFTVGLDI